MYSKNAFVLAILVLCLGSVDGYCWGSLSDVRLVPEETTTDRLVVTWTASHSGLCSAFDRIQARLDNGGASTDGCHGGCVTKWSWGGLSPGSTHTASIEGDTLGFFTWNTKTSASGRFRTACGAGTSWNGASECTTCPRGTFRSGDTYGSGCETCTGQATTVSEGSTSADDCVCAPGEGRVTPEGDCEVCPAGTYRSGHGNGPCVACGAHESSLAGATSADACQCLPGFFRNTTGGCEACGIGTFKTALADANACQMCPVGATTIAEASATEDACQCVRGWSESGGVCLPCEENTYSATIGGTCTQCPGNFGTPTVGSTSADNCTLCLPGFYGPSCAGVCTCVTPQSCVDGIDGDGTCTCGANGLIGALCDVCGHPDWWGPAPWCNRTVTCNQAHGTSDYGFAPPHTGACRGPQCTYTRWDWDADPDCNTCAPHGYDSVPGSGDCLSCDDGWASPTGDACEACLPGTSKSGGQPYARCEQCAPGRFQPAATATTCGTCPRGTYAESPGSTECAVCPAGHTTATRGSASSLACAACPVDTYALPAPSTCAACPGNLTTDGATAQTAPTDCGCPAGAAPAAGNTTCARCGAGWWSAVWGRGQCALTREGELWMGPAVVPLPCPYGGWCAGGDAPLTSNYGFHQAPGAPPGVYEPCTPEEVCLRGNVCARGHEGPRCSVCSDGYARDPQTQLCSYCPPSIPYIFTGMAVLGACVCVVFVRVARKNTAFFTAASVGFNYIQLIAVLSSFKINWPSWVQRFFEYLAATNIDLQLFKPECLVSNSSEAYTTIWLVKILSPWALLSFLAIGNLGYRVWAHCRGLKPAVVNSMHYAFTNAAVMLCFISYLLVSNTALEIFPCEKKSDGSYAMRREPAIECYKSRWYRLLIGSLLSLIFFSVLMPATVAWVLHRRRFNLWKRKNLARYGLLYLRYRPGLHLMELGVLLRKFGVVFGKVVFSQYVVGQVCFAAVVVIGALAAQLRIRPFATLRINRLETLMLICAEMVLFVAMIFAAADGAMSYAVETSFGVFLIMLICATIIILSIAIALEIRKTYRLQQRGLVGRYAVDRLDVWGIFFSSGLFLETHVQSGRTITLVFRSTETLTLHCQIALERAIRHRDQTFSEAEATEISRLERPAAQAVVTHGLTHTCSMDVPRPGHYIVTFVVTPRSDQDDLPALAPPEARTRSRTRLASMRESFATWVDGDATDAALAPEIVRAIMVEGAQRAIRFRVTMSPEWSPTDALTQLDTIDVDFATLNWEDEHTVANSACSVETLGLMGSEDCELQTLDFYDA